MTKIKKFAKVLISLAENKSPEEKKEIIKNFLAILLQKKKIHLVRKILKEVGREKAKKEIILFLAKKIDEKTLKEMKEKLTDFFGKEKEFKIKVDENIIGGFLAKSQNYLVDASVKGLIQELKSKI